MSLQLMWLPRFYISGSTNLDPAHFVPNVLKYLDPPVQIFHGPLLNIWTPPPLEECHRPKVELVWVNSMCVADQNLPGSWFNQVTSRVPLIWTGLLQSLLYLHRFSSWNIRAVLFAMWAQCCYNICQWIMYYLLVNTKEVYFFDSILSSYVAIMQPVL